MPLKDQTIDRIAKIMKEDPAHYTSQIEELQSRGITPEDLDRIHEKLPVDLGIEAGEFTRGALEGLTLGLYQGPEGDPRAGDVSLGPLGEVGVSRALGEGAGTAPWMVGSYGIGAKAAAKVGGMGAPRLVQAGTKMLVGEAIPGTAQGLIRSRGDMDEALKLAGVWTGMGLLGEGVGKVLGGAFKKVKNGVKINPSEKAALNELRHRVGAQLEAQGIKDPGLKKMSLTEITERYPEVYRSMQLGEEAGEISDLILDGANAKFHTVDASTPEMDLQQLGTQFEDDLGRALESASFTAERIDAIKASLGEQYNYLLRAVRDYDITGAEAVDLMEQAKRYEWEPKTMREKVQAGIDKVKRFKSTRFGKEAELIKNRDYVVREGGEEFVGTFKGYAVEGEERVLIFDVDGEERFMASTDFEGATRALEVGGGSAGSPEQSADLQDRTPATQFQIDDMTELEDRLVDLGKRDAVGPRPKNPNVRQAREHIIKLREQVAHQENVNTEYALDGVLRHELGIAREGSKEALADLSVKPGAFSKALGAESMHGLSKNKYAAELVQRGMLMFEDIGAEFGDYWSRYQRAIKSLDADQPGVGDQVRSLIPGLEGTRARTKIQNWQTKQRLLVEALDGDPQKLLSEHPDLMPAYNELRTILDELAGKLKLSAGERVSNYFPHIFHGKTGGWMAGRLRGMTGGRGQFIDEFAEKLSRGKLSALYQRAGKGGYSKDLDAVMHTYIRGAIERPKLNDFARRADRSVKQLWDAGNEEAAQATQSWALHVMGKPGPWKQKWAHHWQNSTLFNDWVDKAVLNLGDESDQALLQRVRNAEPLRPPEPTGDPLGDSLNKQLFDAEVAEQAADEAAAATFFNNLIKEADGKVTSQNLRKKLAVQIEQLRQDMLDPNSRPIVLDKMYKFMVINKLGFSASHYITNLTQTLTNTVPELGVEWTEKGITHALNRGDDALHGRKVSTLLREGKVLQDTPEAREFMQQGLGIAGQLEEIAMKPASWSERFNRSSTYLGAYDKFRSDGLPHDESVVRARMLTNKVHFSYTRAGAPEMMRPSSLRMLLMFRSFASHQIGFTAELIDRALKGDSAPLGRHLLAYLSLAGVGYGLAQGIGASGATRLGEHPFPELVGDVASGNLTDVGGPPADALIDLLSGQVEDAMQEVTMPSVAKRAGRAGAAADRGDPGQAALELMGFAR